MDKKREKLIVYVMLGAMAVINIAIVVAIILGATTVREDEKMVDHTNKVIAEVEIANNLYRTADHTARNRNFSGNENVLLASARQNAVDAIDQLKTIVSDNEKQLKILDALKEDLPNRFKVQDEQFQSVVRENGKITYPTEATIKGSQYAEKIELAFSTLKLNEQELLNGDRLPKLKSTQWSLVYWIFGFAAVNLICLGVFASKYLNALVLLVVTKKVASKASKDPNSVDFDKFGRFIDGESEKFEEFYELP